MSLGSLPLIDSSGGTASLAVTTLPECAWDASTSVNWISGLSPAAGQGTTNVSFRVAANEETATREGLITVNGEEARVAQRAPCRYEIGPVTQRMNSGGGSASITVTTTASDCAWTATAEVAWIEIHSPSGSGSARVTFHVSTNDGAQRTGAISVNGQRVTVTQASGGGTPPPSPPPPSQNPCTYSLSPRSEFVSANEGSGSVTITASQSTCSWTATSNAQWLLVLTGTTGTGNGSVTYRIRANTGNQRAGSLTIAGLTFTVTQGPASNQSHAGDVTRGR